MKIAPEQVRNTMLISGIETVEYQECGCCGEIIFYSRIGDRLFFNAGCGCGWKPPEPRGWGDASHWINGQGNDKCREELMQRFGFSVKSKV
jgi:hypothetical protein